MELVLAILGILVGLGSLACYVGVVIKMFQHNETAMGVVSIVLLFCFGIGALIAFVYGWIRSGQWGITNLMLIWTVLIVVGLVINIARFALAVS